MNVNLSIINMAVSNILDKNILIILNNHSCSLTVPFILHCDLYLLMFLRKKWQKLVTVSLLTELNKRIHHKINKKINSACSSL